METYNLDVLLRAKSEGMGAFKDAENGFAGLAKAAATAAVVLATGVAVAAIEAYKKTEELGQAAYEMGEKFGLAGGQASAWISVAQQLGISNEAIGKGFQFLSKNATTLQLTLDAGGKIAGATAQVYKDLGINVLDAGGHVKGANQLMLEVADAFKAMKDGPEKAAFALRLFGRSGTDLIPILNEGSAGILEMMAQGQKLGTVMSTSQVEAIHKAYLAHKQFDAALQGLTNRIGIAVMPVMARFFDFMVNTGIPAVERLANWVGPYLSAAWTQVAQAAMYFWPTLQQIGAYIKEHVWPAVVQLWAAFTQMLGPAIQYIKAHFDDFKVGLIAVAIVVGIALAAVVIAIALIVGAIIGLVAEGVWLYESFKTIFPKVLGAVEDFVIGAIMRWRDFENTIIGGVRKVIYALDQIPGVNIPLPALIGTGQAGVASVTSKRSGVQAAATGFEGTVYRPTLFLAGEGGAPEDVHIGPRGSGTRGNITIVINGANMTNEQIGGIVARRLRGIGAV